MLMCIQVSCWWYCSVWLHLCSSGSCSCVSRWVAGDIAQFGLLMFLWLMLMCIQVSCWWYCSVWLHLCSSGSCSCVSRWVPGDIAQFDLIYVHLAHAHVYPGESLVILLSLASLMFTWLMLMCIQVSQWWYCSVWLQLCSSGSCLCVSRWVTGDIAKFGFTYVFLRMLMCIQVSHWWYCSVWPHLCSSASCSCVSRWVAGDIDQFGLLMFIWLMLMCIQVSSWWYCSVWPTYVHLAHAHVYPGGDIALFGFTYVHLAHAHVYPGE